jgi:hypothetical protein
VSSPSELSLLWGHQLDGAAAGPAWLWQGYLAAGNLTLLTGAPKGGKTTLLSVLLHHLRTGGTLAGQPVRPGKALVVSEEAPAHWQARRQALHLAEQVCLVCRPFSSRPAPEQWQQLLDHVLALHAAHPFDLVVLDPLSAFLPGRCENHAGALLEALAPLHRLTERGLAVLLAHHPTKRDLAVGLSARGSGALLGFADVVLELRRPAGAALAGRRSCLLGLSRYGQTPPEQLLELNAAGTDYDCVAAPEPEDEFAVGWRPLRLLLEDATGKLTRAQIQEGWPPDFPRPSATTLWRILERATTEGRVCRGGSGRSSDPYRYWLAEKEAAFQADPMQRLREEQQEILRRLHGGRLR